MLDEIKDKVAQYLKLDCDSARMAYIVFKSMEGRARMLKYFGKKSLLQQKVKPLHFERQKLVVREGPDPTMILWENLGYRKS